MDITEAYEYLAPKLSLSEREVLDVIYKSAVVDKPQLSEVLALNRYDPEGSGYGNGYMVDKDNGEWANRDEVIELVRKYFT